MLPLVSFTADVTVRARHSSDARCVRPQMEGVTLREPIFIRGVEYMARRKTKQHVSQKARSKKSRGPEWFSKAGGPPEPGAVWHAPFEYEAKHGLVVKIRGHWERHESKAKAKPKRERKVEAAIGSVERVVPSDDLLKLARKNAKNHAKAKSGEADA